MERVAFSGHSLVYWLRKYVYGPNDKDPHFGFDWKFVEYFGVRGLTIRKTELCLVERVKSFDPDWVILMLGDNDIGNKNMFLPGLATLIIAHAAMMRRHDSVPVIISLLLPRYVPVGSDPSARPFDPSYDSRAFVVNKAIQDELALGVHRNITCWRHKFAVFKCEDKDRYDANRHLFRDDGVHLNDEGHARLYRSFKLLLRGLSAH